MKLLLFCFLCCITIASFAQPQKVLVKKHGIKKVTSITQEEGAPDKTTITYYDDKGNDTSTYSYGSRYQYAVITYDGQGKMSKKETFWDDGKLHMTYVYVYSKDGSFRADDEDAQFKMKSTTWYNSKGNATKMKIPDGTIRTYTYDTKGNIIKFQAISPGKKAKIQTARHKFDSKGRVIESLWSDESKAAYKYDNRGLLIESTTDSPGNEDLSAYKAKTIYTYE